jgi:predicted dinucleotide-binding enzyme
MLEASVIGLGIMGATLTRLLLQQGYHVTFARAIEYEKAAKTTGQFMGHVTLADLRAASQIPQGSQFAAKDHQIVTTNHSTSS